MFSAWETIKTKPGSALVLLALTVRLLALAGHPSYWQVQHGMERDATYFYSLGIEVAGGKGLQEMGQPTAIVPPLYPLFLGGMNRLFGFNRLAILTIQCLLGALAVLYIYRIGAFVFSPGTGLIAALAASFYWPLVLVSLNTLSEALFVPLLLASGYYTIRAFEQPKAGRVIAGAFLLGLASLTRTMVFYLPVVPAAWMVRSFLVRKDKAHLQGAVLYLLIFMLTLVPWAARNYVRFGHFIATSTNSGMVLASGNMPYQGKIFGMNLDQRMLEPSQQYIFDLPEVQRDRALKGVAIDALRKNPERVPRLVLLKFLFFWSPFDWELLGRGQGVFNAFFVWVLLFAAFGLWRLKWRPEYFYVYATVCYFLAVCLVSYGSPRLRLPADPFLILVAAAGWEQMQRKLGDGFKTWAVLGLVVAGSVAGHLFSEPIRLACRALLIKTGIW